MTPNVHSILHGHVSLSVACLDRLYVNAYVPTLQTPGQLCFFLKKHLGHPIPSPALFAPMPDRFVAAVRRFTQQHRVPVLQFERRQRKHDIANQRRAQFRAPEGVVFVGVAQEKARRHLVANPASCGRARCAVPQKGRRERAEAPRPEIPVTNPPPRRHPIAYFGLFAAHATARAALTGPARRTRTQATAPTAAALAFGSAGLAPPSPQRAEDGPRQACRRLLGPLRRPSWDRPHGSSLLDDLLHPVEG
jgi:hypothetical protein